MTHKTDFGLNYWIYCTLYIHNSGLQAITLLSLIYTHYISPLHAHCDLQSSLVVSWQTDYNRLTVTSNHT
jgi:hypothetical protein